MINNGGNWASAFEATIPTRKGFSVKEGSKHGDDEKPDQPAKDDEDDDDDDESSDDEELDLPLDDSSAPPSTLSPMSPVCVSCHILVCTLKPNFKSCTPIRQHLHNLRVRDQGQFKDLQKD